jgi:hypothetical protein
MSENLIRAVTPLWLATCSVVIIGMAIFAKLETTSFNTVANIASAAIGAAGGAAMASSKRVTAENVENLDMDSDTPTKM